ncbi:MarR family winged helix-turn-helix transcriptional regulator [Lachnospiraceae bacterium 62-35]
MKAKDCGLKKGQPRILDFVSLHEGCFQREICNEYSLEAASVSNFLAILEQEGVLYRQRNPQSSRKVNVYTTEKGREVQKKLDVVYNELEEIIFQGFSVEEKEQCNWYLSRLTKNMMLYFKTNTNSFEQSDGGKD